MRKLLALLFSLCAFLSYAYDFSAVNEDGILIYYKLLSSSTCEVAPHEVKKYTERYHGNIRIPEYVNYSNGKTLKVVSIGKNAFKDCLLLTSVTIPVSVTKIGDNAFEWCKELTSVTIPNSVTKIGDNAFKLCSSLSSVSLSDSVSTIGKSTFSGCSSLASIKIPNSVTSIGEFAFYGCISLESVEIGNNVTNIAEGAFLDCSSLSKANFSSLEHLCSIKFDGYSSNPLVYAHHLFINNQEVVNLVIPNSVTKIGAFAFCDCSFLTSVVIPNSVTSIYESAFHGCSNVTSVSLPDSLTFLGGSVFCRCSSLSSVQIPNGITSIRYGAFNSCSSLTSIVIPSSVTWIAESSFAGCSSLASVVIGDNITSISEKAFEGCSSLSVVKVLAIIPPSIKFSAFNYSGNVIPSILMVPIGTKSKYETAETWMDFSKIVEFDPNNEDIDELDQLTNSSILISSNGYFFNISGADNINQIEFFSVSGKLLGAKKVVNGEASFGTEENIVIVKIGEKSIKIKK